MREGHAAGAPLPSGTCFLASRNGMAAVLAGPAAAVGRLDLEGDARLGQADRHPHVADVLLEPRRPDEVGHGPDRVAVVERGQLARDLERAARRRPSRCR